MVVMTKGLNIDNVKNSQEYVYKAAKRLFSFYFHFITLNITRTIKPAIDR